MNILLIRLSSFGDVVLQTSLCKWIKEHHPSAKITFVTSKGFESLLLNHPNIDQVISYDKKNEELSALIERLKKLHRSNSFSFVFDAHGVLKSWRIRLAFWYIPQITVQKRRWRRFLITKLPLSMTSLWRSPFFGMENLVERNQRDLGFLFSKPAKDQCSTQLASFRFEHHQLQIKKYIVIAPSASFATKKYPAQKFIDLIENIFLDDEFKTFKIVLIAADTSELGILDQYQHDQVINLAGKSSILETASIIENAKLVITCDSLPTHIASAYNTPVVTIFGPTREVFGFAPYRNNGKTVSQELWCSPCSTTGKKKCFRGEQYCFTTITETQIIQKMKEALQC